MGLKRIELSAKLFDEETDEVQASQKTVWAGLSPRQVLFIEKHILRVGSGLNKEAVEFLDSGA